MFSGWSVTTPPARWTCVTRHGSRSRFRRSGALLAAPPSYPVVNRRVRTAIVPSTPSRRDGILDVRHRRLQPGMDLADHRVVGPVVRARLEADVEHLDPVDLVLAQQLPAVALVRQALAADLIAAEIFAR